MADRKTPQPDDKSSKTPGEKTSPTPTPFIDDEFILSKTQPKVPDIIAEDDDDALVDFGAVPDVDEVAEPKSRSQMSGPLSGTSVVSWSDLMRARSEAVIDLDGPESIDFDAESDKDLLAQALADETPSGEGKSTKPIPEEEESPDDFVEFSDEADARGGRSATGRGQVSQRHAIPPDFDDPMDQSSSVWASPDEPRRAEDSSRVNLLHDLAAPKASSGSSQKTDQLDSPIILSPPDDDDAVAEIGGAPMGGIESSAVDLGSQSVVDLPFPLASDSSVRTGGSSGTKSKQRGSSRSGFEDSGTVDLLGSGRGSGLSSLPGLTAVGSGHRPDSALGSTAVVQVNPSRTSSWLGGGLLGILAGVGVCVGVWLTGALSGPGDSKSKDGSAKSPAAVAAPGLNLLDSGELDQAITALAAQPATPETRTALGQARLLVYLRSCKQQGARPAADNDDLKKAADDLAGAGTPTGELWRGLLEESLGQTDKAKGIYEAAKGKYADQAKLFQAALDRLDTRAAPSNRPRADLGATLFTLLAHLEPNQTPDEAGFEFWNAVKLAKAHKYPEAQAALAAARAAHDVRRFVLARKGLNPTSDPLEESFLRCCDELSVHWLVREELRKGGYQQPFGTDHTVRELLKQEKAAKADLKKVNDSLTPVKDAITKANLDPANLSAAFATIIHAKDLAEGAIAKVREEATNAMKARTTAEEELAKGKTDLTAAEAKARTAEEELKKTRDQMAAMKPATGDNAAELTKLRDELKQAREKLAAMKLPAGDNATELSKLRDERTKLESRAKELEAELNAARERSERATQTARAMDNVLQNMRQKLQVTGGANEVLDALDKALTTKAAPPAGLPAELPATYATDPRAERAFGRGIIALRSGDWSAAEGQFLEATKLHDRDARYWYFLGLARSALGNSTQAAADFQKGVDRERRNLPNPSVIDAVLERLPAQARQAIEAARRR